MLKWLHKLSTCIFYFTSGYVCVCIYIYIYIYIQGVSEGTVNILGVVVWTIPSKYVRMNMCPIFNGCGDTAV